MARYVPVLRTKAGEAQALGKLTGQAKERILPLMNLTAAVPPTFQQIMISESAGASIAIDGSYNLSETGTANAFNALFTGLGNGGLLPIPCIPFSSDPAYIAAAVPLIGQFATGLAVQAALSDLPNLQSWMQAQSLNPQDIDLIVMAGGVADHNPTAFGGYVTHALNTTLPNANQWRSVSLNSWSAPRDYGAVPHGRSLVPRKDWHLWSQVAPTVQFPLDYSDMGHLHPSLEEPPGYVMATATVSVRYTIDDNWIVIKGVRTTGPNGIQMTQQYRAHAQSLVSDTNFNGLQHGCWADNRIRHYATTTGGAGGRPQWAAVMINRHISFIADRLP